MIRSVVLLLTVGLSGEPAGPQQSPAAKELARLQGTWRLVATEARGQKAERGADRPLQWVVKGNKITNTVAGREIARITTLDPTAAVKLLDLTYTGGEQPAEGIYRLNGDVWTICLSIVGEGVKERPTAFTTTKDGPGRVILIFKREAP
jgi:uncharacterized protein (TIGR03067 family)